MILDNIKDLGFQHAGELLLQDNKLQAVFTEHGVQVTPGVYCWVAVDTAGDATVIYVGKFGGTLPKRLSEHAGGFRGGSASGVKKAAHVTQCIQQGQRVYIWAKPSAQCEICYTNVLGDTVRRTVTTESTDEITLIQWVSQQQGKPVLNGTRGG